MKNKLRVLQLCHKPPMPILDGGALAINQITRGLKEKGLHVSVLTVETDKHPFNLDLFSTGKYKPDSIDSVYIDTRIKPFDAFLNFVKGDNYNLIRFKSNQFEKKLIEILKTQVFDVVQLESLYVAVYFDVIKKYSPDSKIVYRSHNIEFLIWERLAENSNSFPKKVYLHHLAKTLKNEEVEILKKINAVASISKKEVSFFKSLGIENVKHIPFGVSFKENEKELHIGCHEKIHFFHLASMDWQPNIEAVDELLNHVWDDNLKSNPNVQLTIAGRYMPDRFLKFNNVGNIKVLSEVEDAHKFMENNHVLLLPLLSGGGIRIKVIEAMREKKCVVSYPVGIEGLEVDNGKDVIVSNSRNKMKDDILRLIENPSLISQIGNNGYKKAKEYYNSQTIITNLIELYNEC